MEKGSRVLNAAVTPQLWLRLIKTNLCSMHTPFWRAEHWLRTAVPDSSHPVGCEVEEDQSN